jgi:nucleoside-diphosphate-sugar epimerase
VEDVAAAIALTVQDERAAGQVYNVGEPEALTEVDWARAIGEQAGWQGEVRILPDQELPEDLAFDGDPRHSLVASTEKVRGELGFRERVTRAEALRRTIEWEIGRMKDEG